MSLESHYQARSKDNDNRGTPKGFWEKVGKILGLSFDDYDPCSLNPQGFREEDGLGPAPDWVRCYNMNIPYSRGQPEKWLEKARNDQLAGKTVVVLCKGDWTTQWYKQWGLPFAQMIPVVGRMKFVGMERGAPFTNMVLVYRPGIVPTNLVIYP